MSVLTAATPTSAWIGGTAATASPYTVTWKDASTSLSSGYTNWDPSTTISADNLYTTVFALAVMEYAVGVSKFGKNPKTLLVHQY